jgi:hypothetical protein
LSSFEVEKLGPPRESFVEVEQRAGELGSDDTDVTRPEHAAQVVCIDNKLHSSHRP